MRQASVLACIVEVMPEAGVHPVHQYLVSVGHREQVRDVRVAETELEADDRAGPDVGVVKEEDRRFLV